MWFADKFMEPHNSRVVGLDIVRAIAILLVVYGHGVYLLPEKFHKYYYIPIPLIDGVSIFFVLSGFLIGGILLKIIQNGNFTSRDLLNFWLRRWFRTLPNYFIVLSGLLIYQMLLYNNLGGVNFKYILFLQNFVSAHPPMFAESWSLCVEEWFYLLFPVACFIFYRLLKNKSKSVLLSAVLFILPPLIFRVLYYYNGINADNWDSNIRKVVVFRLDSLMYGIIGAYLVRFQKNSWIKFKNICFVSSLIILLYLTIYWRMKPSLAFLAVYQYNLESLATLLSLPYLSELKSIKFKFITFIITFISIISYSMYLLNYSVVQCRLLPLSLSFLGLNGLTGKYLIVLTYIMYWVYILFGSFILYKYFEKPMMDLRNRITQ
jgi:peptidoglycan/LPS O-acetylase OafA/YrhL